MSRLSLLIRRTLPGVLALNLCFAAAAYAQPGGGVPVRSTVVAGQAGADVPRALKKYVGNIEAIEQVDSVARVSGTLTVAPGFEEGSFVKKGQLLFTIDQTPYKAKVDAAEAAIAQTKARIEYAKSNYNRLNDLFEKNAGSKDDKESAFASLKSLEAELLSAQAQLVLAQEDLKYTEIRSEIDGRAGRRAYSTGNYVTPQSSALVRVVQMDPIYIRFTMSERDYISMFGNAESLKETSQITATLPNDQLYNGKGEISFVDNSVKSTTDTIKIWAKFDNPNGTLTPGGVVSVNLAKVGADKVATVEPPAVQFDGKDNFVYILVDSISDEDLFKEIAADSRFSGAIAAATEELPKAIDALVAGSEGALAELGAAVEKAAMGLGKNRMRFDSLTELAQLVGAAAADPENAAAQAGALKTAYDAFAEEFNSTFLAKFKATRYQYEVPGEKKGEMVAVNDFENNTVSPEYKLVLRRNVELGPSNGDVETILKGIEPGELVMMDGVNKARPFDLVIPKPKTQRQEAAAPADETAAAKAKTKATAPVKEAKRVAPRKPSVARADSKTAGADA